MHGLALIYVIRDLAGVQSFKIVQESKTATRVLLVVDAAFDPANRDAIAAGFKRRLGDAVDVTVELVDSIPAEKSGKFRYVVSHVAQPA